MPPKIALCRNNAHRDITVSQVELAYRTAPLVADYLRAAAGIGLCAIPLATMQPVWPVALVLAGLLVMFGGFLAQTWRRQHTRVLLAPSGVALSGRPERRLAWTELKGLRLRWFGTRRQGRGWLELELSGNGRRLVISSALQQFEAVVAAACKAARANGIALDAPTAANIDALLRRPAAAAPAPPTRPDGSWAPRG